MSHESFGVAMKHECDACLAAPVLVSVIKVKHVVLEKRPLNARRQGAEINLVSHKKMWVLKI